MQEKKRDSEGVLPLGCKHFTCDLQHINKKQAYNLTVFECLIFGSVHALNDQTRCNLAEEMLQENSFSIFSRFCWQSYFTTVKLSAKTREALQESARIQIFDVKLT